MFFGVAFFYIQSMNTPKINRLIGYVFLFFGFFLFYKGFKPVGLNDDIADADFILLALAIDFLIGSMVWMIKKVRCPHCNKLLHLKLYNIDVCPHCGKSTDPDEK